MSALWLLLCWPSGCMSCGMSFCYRTTKSKKNTRARHNPPSMCKHICIQKIICVRLEWAHVRMWSKTYEWKDSTCKTPSRASTAAPWRLLDDGRLAGTDDDGQDDEQRQTEDETREATTDSDGRQQTTDMRLRSVDDGRLQTTNGDNGTQRRRTATDVNGHGGV